MRTHPSRTSRDQRPVIGLSTALPPTKSPRRTVVKGANLGDSRAKFASRPRKKCFIVLKIPQLSLITPIISRNYESGDWRFESFRVRHRKLMKMQGFIGPFQQRFCWGILPAPRYSPVWQPVTPGGGKSERAGWAQGPPPPPRGYRPSSLGRGNPPHLGSEGG